MAALAHPPRVLKYFLSETEMSGVRVGGALAALAAQSSGRLRVERVADASAADFIWLNTPVKSLKAACAAVGSYNRVAGASLALEHKARMARLQERMGERTLETYAFPATADLAAYVEAHAADLPGAWVVKDATANSGAGLWFAASPGDLARIVAEDVQARGDVVLQRYLPNPMLWRGRKLQFRVYAVWRGRECFCYRGAMAQVCAAPYRRPGAGEALDPTAHITNVSVNKGDAAFVPERPIDDLSVEHAPAFAAIARCLRSLARAAAPALDPDPSRFELVGVDFLIDDDAADPTAWLVECNCPPNSFGSEETGPIERFHHGLVADLLEKFVLHEGGRNWIPVEPARESPPRPPFSSRFGPALAFSKFDRAAAANDRATALGLAPPAAAAAAAAKARALYALYATPPTAEPSRDLDGRWGFFENAGGSQVPKAVAAASAAALDARWRDVNGARAKADARIWAGEALGAAAGDVFFAANASSAFRTIGAALAAAVGAGTVVVTDASHDANLAPWAAFAQRRWRLDAAGSLAVADLSPLLDASVGVVAVPHASNVTGALFDLAAIVRAVRASPARDALILVDGVAYFPHRRVAFDACGADAYVVAFHKAFGPHLAAVAVSPNFRKRAVPPNATRAGAAAFEVGTVSAEACAGVASLRGYCGEFGDLAAYYAAVATAEAAPFRRLLAFLGGAARVALVPGGRGGRAPTAAFSHAALKPAAIVAHARRHRIALRCGDFLSPRLLDALLPAAAREHGVVRVSLAHYNTLAEIDALCACLERHPDW